MHTSVSLPCTPEFAVSIGKVFEIRLRNNLWNSGVHQETRFDLHVQIILQKFSTPKKKKQMQAKHKLIINLISMRMPKFLFLRRHRFKDISRNNILHTYQTHNQKIKKKTKILSFVKVETRRERKEEDRGDEHRIHRNRRRRIGRSFGEVWSNSGESVSGGTCHGYRWRRNTSGD